MIGEVTGGSYLMVHLYVIFLIEDPVRQSNSSQSVLPDQQH
jgi:hypothetical protein